MSASTTPVIQSRRIDPVVQSGHSVRFNPHVYSVFGCLLLQSWPGRNSDHRIGKVKIRHGSERNAARSTISSLMHGRSVHRQRTMRSIQLINEP